MAHQKFEKYFMAHQYMPKIFHDPHKNPPAPSPNVRSLIKNIDPNKAHGHDEIYVKMLS